MINFLRDPIWQFGGFVVAAIGIIVGIWLSLRGRSKNLTYEIISKTSLLNVDARKVEQRLQILFDGSPINNAELILLKIINIGSTPIHPNDFYQPLTITTGESSRILDARITATQPSGLTIEIVSMEDTLITLEQVLLNPKDNFIIQIVVVPQAEVAVKARIAGVKKIERGVHKSYSQRVIATSFIWIVGTAVVFFAWSGFENTETTFTLIALGFMYFLGGVVLPRLMKWIKDAM